MALDFHKYVPDILRRAKKRLAGAREEIHQRPERTPVVLDTVTRPSEELGQMDLFFRKTALLLAIALVGYILYDIRSLLGIFVISGFLTLAFSPWLNRMNRWYIPDWLGMIVIFLILAVLGMIVMFSVIPIFIDQATLLVSTVSAKIESMQVSYQLQGAKGLGLPSWISRYIDPYIARIDIGSILTSLKANLSAISTTVSENLKTIATSSLSIVASVTNSLFQGVLVAVVTFFMVLERAALKDVLYRALPYSATRYLVSREKDITSVFESWIRGQSLLAGCMFITTYFGLHLIDGVFDLGLSSHFTLALIVGVMEFLPSVGPFLAFLPALALALGISSEAVIWVSILYIALQQLENNILVPWVMKRTLNLSPFLTLIAMLIGASIAGIFGVFVAVPVAALISLVWSDFFGEKAKS